jgi:hypothetical protein
LENQKQPKDIMTTTPPPTDTLSRWYYADSNNQPQGPVTAESLQSLLQSGTITLETLVLPEGGSDWIPYRSVSAGAKPLVPIPPSAVTKAETTRKCPFCAELISAEAKKCKHCGETVDVALRAAEEAKRAQANPMVFMNAGGGGGSAVVAPEKRKFPHLIHFILTLFTGVWGIIWILHYIFRDKNYYR